MKIYYFNGNKVKGFDLTNELEDISVEYQKKKILLKLGFTHNVFKYKSLHDCIDLAKGWGVKFTPINPNSKVIEGEHEDRLYYLHKYVIKWCRKRSLKALLIRLIGVNIEKQ